MRKQVWKNLEIKTSGVLLLVIALLAGCLYYAFYIQYNRLMISKLQDEALVIHRYAEEVISEASFTELNTIEDEQSELYMTVRSQLNNIRRIANILYLYTVKTDADGNFIYVVDGIYDEDLSGDGYFCHIGDLIEDDIIELIKRCFAGEVILGDGILKTEWGIVYVAYFPFHSSNGDIIGAIGMEFDCENLYLAAGRTRLITIAIALLVSFVFIITAYILVRRFVNDAVSAFSDAEKGKAEAEEMLRSIMNASPMACHIWTPDGKIADCNKAALELFGYKSKQKYLDGWLLDCNPEYQPGGQNSEKLGKAFIDQALAEGKCVFTWMHVLLDGSAMPAEVTLVRFKSGGDTFVSGYTRDLRKERELEARVGDIYKDALTDTYTKQYLDNRLPRLIKTLSRSACDLSVILTSIDFLQPYFDAYGTYAGEKCLRTVSEILSAVARRVDDFIVRYRDDEFLIVLPNTDKAGARLIAENLIDVMHDWNIPHEHNSAASYVTLSIGVTSGRVNHRQRVSDYVKRAEEMLFLAKHGGHNGYSYSDL